LGRRKKTKDDDDVKNHGVLVDDQEENIEKQAEYVVPWEHGEVGQAGGAYDSAGPAFNEAKARVPGDQARKDFTKYARKAKNQDVNNGNTRKEKYGQTAKSRLMVATPLPGRMMVPTPLEISICKNRALTRGSEKNRTSWIVRM
jgi:hypothetical protein